MAITRGDAVVVEYTGRIVDGPVFDTSRESVAKEHDLAAAQPDRDYSPITIEIGSGRVIEGLEEGLVGLEEGTTTTVTVPPEKGYGEWTEDHVQEFDREELTEAIGGQTPEEGAYLERADGGSGEIVDVDDEPVRVDFNQPLAGETLEFDVEVVDVTEQQ